MISYVPHYLFKFSKAIVKKGLCEVYSETTHSYLGPLCNLLNKLILVTFVMDMSDPLHWASHRPLDGTPRQRQHSQKIQLERQC